MFRVDETCRNLAYVFHQRFINMVKQSTISTGQLHASLRLHFRPIYLVVYKGSLAQTCMQMLSSGGLHA